LSLPIGGDRAMKVEKFALATAPAAYNAGAGNLLNARDYVETAIDTAQDIVIISAFYSESFIKKILGAKRSATKRIRKLIVVLAPVPEVIRNEQIERLRILEADIDTLGICAQNVLDIRLADGTRFLHAKLLRIQSTGKLPIYVIGSANISNTAFGQNDEVMVAIEGPHLGLNEYVDHVIRNSKSIQDYPNSAAAHNWRNFLRNAYLYFRPNRSISYTIDPFAEVEFGEIAGRLRDQAQQLPFSDRNALGLNLCELLKLDGLDNTNLGFRLPTYSVETDYGYWVPKKYVDLVETRIQKLAQPKRRALETRGQELQETGKTYTKNRLKIYFSEVDKRLLRGTPKLSLSRDQKDAIFEKIFRRAEHLAKLLTHPKTLDRLSRALVGGPVPEFWEDEMSVDRFFESFCYDISIKLTGPKNTPKIITHLATEFSLKHKDDAEICRAKIERFFDRGGSWEEENWP
jgi:hypothetical protein